MSANDVSTSDVSNDVLLEIADVIDVLCVARAAVTPAAEASEAQLRRELFTLLDKPTQATWERVREMEIAPQLLPGMTVPSPLGITLGDAVYAFGLPDVACPSRASIMAALRWVVRELKPVASGRPLS
ncbi:MAG: hypothetical protein LBB54_07395 [Cellulomonadaceae bacterium]|nr:hypothetical protein [Cellulomonadaceae bacterium]